MEEKNKSTDLKDPESRIIDGWPTWLEIRRGILVLIFILAPAVILSTYLPTWIQSYHITGEALWGLKRKGVPDEVIFNFSQSLIRHYDPIEQRRLQQLSEEKDALFKEANDL